MSLNVMSSNIRCSANVVFLFWLFKLTHFSFTSGDVTHFHAQIRIQLHLDQSLSGFVCIFPLHCYSNPFFFSGVCLFGSCWGSNFKLKFCILYKSVSKFQRTSVCDLFVSILTDVASPQSDPVNKRGSRCKCNAYSCNTHIFSCQVNVIMSSSCQCSAECP